MEAPNERALADRSRQGTGVANLPVRVRLGCSPWMVAVILLMNVAACAAVFAGGMPALPKCVFVAALLTGCAWAVAQFGLRAAGCSVVGLERDAGGRWELSFRDGRVDAATLAGVDYLHPRLVCLSFSLEQARPRSGCPAQAVAWLLRRRQRVVVPSDAASPAAHRRLRVALRTQAR